MAKRRTAWLSPQEQRAWRRLAAVTTLLPAALEAQLQRDAELTHFGYWVLAMLSESPTRSMRMSELAAISNGSQSRLSHLVAKLEAQGWVRRTQAANDRRGAVATLTDAGFAKVVDAAPGHVAEVRQRIFNALTPHQVEQLDAICGAILRQFAGPIPIIAVE